MREKFLPFVASTPKQIHDFPVNTSSAKQQYSIPKAERFNLENSVNNSGNFYEMPSMQSKRAAGFGYGQKHDFSRMANQSPAPNKYNFKDSSFDESVQKHKGYSFGLGREELHSVGTVIINKAPGPGSYEPKNLRHSVSYTIRARTTTFNEEKKKKAVPGPGNYKDVGSLNASGRYVISKFKYMGGTVISPPSYKRFASVEAGTKVPGPGQYHPKTDLNDKGSYFLSKFKSNVGKSFPQFTRDAVENKTSKIVPGPGSYRLPSDFGFYKPMKNNH